MRDEKNESKLGRSGWHALTICVAMFAAVASRGQDSTSNQGSLFVGSRACGGCHATIFRRQETSNHALSLRMPADVTDMFKTLPFEFEDRSSKTHLTLLENSENQLELEARKGDQRAVLKLRWAFGSARRGITPVGVRDDGTIVESRLSWFPFDGGYSLTPGATRIDPQSVVESLGRAMTLDDVQQCFSCHTTDYKPTPSGPLLNEMGIHCERCHGPGLEHTRAWPARILRLAVRIERFSIRLGWRRLHSSKCAEVAMVNPRLIRIWPPWSTWNALPRQHDTPAGAWS